MTAIELLSDLHRQGFTLIPLPEGKLAVKPAARLTDPLREHIRQCKAEVLSLLASSPTWLCPNCRAVVRYDPLDATIFPSRLWRCLACETLGVSRDKAPAPVAWITTHTFP
jgi:TubC N-terminal docking domain